MRLIRQLGTPLLALAAFACAKQGTLPIAVTGQNVKVATGQTVLLDGTGSSKDVVSYQWSFKTLPQGSRARIESPNQASTRFTPDVPTGSTDDQTYQVQLVVRNKYYQSLAAIQKVEVVQCGMNAPTVGILKATPAATNVGVPVGLAAPDVDDKDNHADCQTQLGGKLQLLRYQWSFVKLPAGSRARLNDTAAVMPSFTPDVNGLFTVQLVVTDSTGLSSQPAQVDVQVSACGSALPVVNSIASSPLQPNLAQVTQLTAVITDADEGVGCNIKQRYSYNWQILGLPAGSAAQLNGSGLVNPSFVPDVPGDYTFRLVVTNQTSLSSAPRDFVVTARTCGGAPPNPIVSFSPGSVGIGTPVQLHATPQDDDASCGVIETFSYAWSLVTVPAGSMTVIVNPGGSDASFTPDLGGDYAVQVRIVDSNGTSASALTHVTVRGCGNNPPSVDKLQNFPLTPLVGQSVHTVATVSAVDSSCPFYNPSQSFRWSLISRPPGSSAALRDPTATAADFTPDVSGTYQLQLVVTDAKGLRSNAAVLSIATSTCGLAAPTIVAAGANPVAPDPGRLVTLFVQPDNSGACNVGDAISIAWRITSRPVGSNAALSDPTSSHPTFTPDVVGSYQFQVIATNAGGLQSAPSWVTITTTTCGTSTPSVTAAPANIAVSPGQSVQLSATPLDPNTICGMNETFIYQWQVTSAPGASSAPISNPMSAAPQFKPDVAGDYQLSVTVTDSSGKTSPASFVHITAAACDSLPPLSGIVSYSSPATLGMPVTLSTTGAVSRNCVKPGPLSYAWKLTSRPLQSSAILSDPGAASPTFTPDKSGTYGVQLVVSDAVAASTPTFAAVAVASCASSVITWNATPIVTTLQDPQGTPAGLPNVGTQVQLAAQFTDSNAGCGLAVTPYTYRWSIVSKPARSNATLSSTSASTPFFVTDVVGAYQVAVQIVDALGTTSSVQFLSVTTTSCGTTPPAADIAPAAPISLNTFDTQILNVAGGAATDADNLAANCPGRFNVSFSYEWKLLSTSGATITSTSGTATTFQGQASGSYAVQLTAIGTNGTRSAPAIRNLTVAPCGSHTPQMVNVTASDLTAGAATAMPPVGHMVRLTANATSVDIAPPSCNDSLSYLWSQVSVPAGTAFTPPTAASTSPNLDFTADVAGTYAFQVVAVNSHGVRSAPWPVQVTTAVCAPVWGSANQSVSVNFGNTVTLSVPLSGGQPNVSDSCVKAPLLGYRWTVVSAPRGSGAVLSSSTGTSVTFTPDLIGSWQFQIVAVDQAGFTSSPTTIALSVGTCGANAPGLDYVVSSLTSPNAGDLVTFSVHTVTDNNTACAAGKTQPYTYQWSIISAPPGSHATIGNGATPNFIPDVPGTYQVAVRLTDALGNVSNVAFLLSPLTTTNCGGTGPITSQMPGSPWLYGFETTLGTGFTFLGVPTSSFNGRVGIWAKTLGAATQKNLTGSGADFGSTIFYPGSLFLILQPGQAGEYSIVRWTAPATGSYAISTAWVGLAKDVGTTTDLHVLKNGTELWRGDLNATLATSTAPGSAVSSPYSANVGLSAGDTLDFAVGIGLDGGFVSDSTGLSATITNTATLQVWDAFNDFAWGTGLNAAISPQPIGASQLTTPALTPLALTGSSTNTDNTSCPARFNASTSLAWSIVSAPIGAHPSLSSTTLANTAFQADLPGTYLVQLVATASNGRVSAPVRVTILVGACGATAPTILSVATKVGGLQTSRPPVSSTVTLSANAVSGDNMPGGVCGGSPMSKTFTYRYSVVSLPAGANVSVPAVQSGSPDFSFVPNVAGTYVFSVVATDNTGLSSAPFTVSVPTGPCGPGLTSIFANNASPSVGQAITLNRTPAGAIPDSCVPGATLAYQWSVAARPWGSGAGFVTPAGDAPQIFTPDVAGNYILQLVVTDSGGFSTSAQTTIRAGGCTAGPTITATPTFSAAEPPSWTPSTVLFRDDVVTLSLPSGAITPGGCGSPVASQYSYSWAMVSRPAGSAAQLNSTSVPAPSFVADVPGGTWQAMVTVTDGLGTASSPAFVTVGPASTCGGRKAAPVITPVSPVSTNSFQPVTLSATVADPSAGPECPARLNSAPFTLAWSLAATPAGSRGATFTSSGSSATLTPFSPGRYDVKLVATSRDGIASTLLTPVTANQCGANSPVLGTFLAHQLVGTTSIDSPAALDGRVDATLSVGVTDADSACSGVPAPSFTYVWSLVGKPASSAAALTAATSGAPVPSPGQATAHIVPDASGSYSVQLSVTDDTGLTASNIYGFTVSTTCGVNPPVVNLMRATQTFANSAPVVSTSTTPQNLNVSFPVTLDATVTDPNESIANCTPPLVEQPFAYAWTLAASPAGSRAVLSGGTSVTPSFVPDVVGTYTLRVTVTDLSGLSATSSFSVQVTCGGAPPQIADSGSTPAFKATQVVPLVATTTTAVGNFSIVHSTLGAAGPDVNAKVQFYPNVAVSFAANATGSTCLPGGDPLSYSWTLAAAPVGSVATISAATSATPSLVPDVAGEYDVRLAVTNSSGLTTTAVFSQLAGKAIVGVSSCGAQLPTAQIGIDLPVAVAAPVTAVPWSVYTSALVGLNGSTSSTPDTVPLNVSTGGGCGLNPTLSYQWSLASKPAGSADAVGSATRINPTLIPTSNGTYKVQLVVSDGAHASFPAIATLQAAQAYYTTSSFTGTPTSGIVADGVASSLLTVTAKDASGIPIAGAPVGISGTGSKTVVTQSAPNTPANGVVTATVTSTKASPPTVIASASVGALTFPNVLITFVPGPASKLTFLPPGVQPTTVVQNNPIITTGPGGAVRVVIEDANNNPILPTQTGGTNSTITLKLHETTPAGVVLSFNGTPCPAAGCTATSAALPPTFNIAGADFVNLSVNKQGTAFHLDVSGTSPLSPPTTLTPATSSPFDVIAPPPPSTGPTTVVATGHIKHITVTWDPFPDVNLIGYNVYRAPGGTTNFSKVATTCASNTSVSTCTNSFDDTGLGDGVSYAYQVTAVNTATTSNNPPTPGEGPFSATATGITTPPPPVITALTAGNKQVNVTWNTSTSATKYRVLRAGNAGGPFTQVFGTSWPQTAIALSCSVTSCSFLDINPPDTTLQNNNPYFYVVGALNDSGPDEQDSASAGPVTPVQPPDPNHCSLTLQPGSADPPIADGSNTYGAKLVVLIADASGVGIPNTQVTLSNSPTHAGDVFTATSGVTGNDGTFRATLKSSIAESKTISAVAGPTGNQITLTLKLDFLGTTTVTSLVFTQQPGAVVVGQPFAVVVSALDAGGNPTSAPSGTVTLLRQAGPGGGTLGGTLTQSLQSGVANFTDLTVSAAGTTWQLRAVTNLSGATRNSATFTATAAPIATAYTAVSTSRHSCTVKSDGTLWCWGPNDRGQLGNGTTTSSTQPVQVGTATDWTSVTTGSNFTCGVETKP
jgi:hypothetical protein